LLLVTVASFD